MLQANLRWAVGEIRESWKEEAVESTLTVAPYLRGHITAPGGATIKRLEEQCAGVMVEVPPLGSPASKCLA